jgi:glycerophosphoryl diester phosphodiesterase
MLPETLDARERPVRLIHHAANCGHSHAPGSPAALAACLAAGAAIVEIDVLPLADGSFALLHDRDLSVETSAQGDAIRSTREQIEPLFYKTGGEKVGFLENAIAIFADFPDAERLQLDLKPYTPLTRALLRDFVEIIQLVQDRVQVTSVADWAVRSLHRFAPELALGFDPLLYLDLLDNEPRPKGVPPFRVGAYGLLDDHPLAAYQWGKPGEYFAARAGALLVQAPAGCEWYIRADLLDAALQAGFNWIEFLHQNGSRVDGWTIDVDNPDHLRIADSLVDHDIDELTTDTPAKLASVLRSETIY